MELKDIPKGYYGQTQWYTDDEAYEMEFLNQEDRQIDMLDLFQRFSGSQFSIPMLAKRYGVSERQIQVDLADLEKLEQIKREKVFGTNGKSQPNKIWYTQFDKLDKSMVLPKVKHLNQKI